MARVLLLFVFLSFQILQYLAQEQDPSVGEYFLEAVDSQNRNHWRYFLPEDTDIDQDGNLSDLEIQHKFNTYMGEVFKLMDHDKDNSITEEELRSLKLDIPHLTKAVDIALENFPLKPYFLAADANGDGVFDENDFLMPEKKKWNRPTTVQINPIYKEISKYNEKYNNAIGITRIGQKEGNVICKSLAYEGLDKIVLSHEMQWHSSPRLDVTAYSCEGTEEFLEDCQEVEVTSEEEKAGGMGVICKEGEDKVGDLRLVGGKDSSSGDIYFGKRGLTCHPGKLENSEVICRQLGFSGVLRITTSSAFTGISINGPLRAKTHYSCNGDERSLKDCPIMKDRNCFENQMYGVICATDGKPGMDRGLSDMIVWRWTSRFWEENGKILFIADANGDGKLTLQEMATKGKEIITKALDFLDQSQDGKLSLEDINLNLSIGPLQNLIMEMFDIGTAGKGELVIFNMEILGQDIGNEFGIKKFGALDVNTDEKVTAADLFMFIDSREKAMFLLPMLSEKLDKNQDGKIQREELGQFIDEMFDQLDMDKNGALTLKDVYSLMRENGFDCLQVGALRSYIKVFLDTAATSIRNFFGYILHQLDIDGNGQISSEELEQMHVPCDGRYRAGNNPYDPNSRKECGRIFDNILGSIGDVIRYFPDSIFSERDGRGGGGYRIKRWGGDGHGRGKGGRHQAHKETLVDKMTNYACEMLT